MKKIYISGLLILSLLSAAITLMAFKYRKPPEKPNAGLIVPQGFTVVKLIEGIGKVREESGYKGH